MRRVDIGERGGTGELYDERNRFSPDRLADGIAGIAESLTFWIE